MRYFLACLIPLALCCLISSNTIGMGSLSFVAPYPYTAFVIMDGDSLPQTNGSSSGAVLLNYVNEVTGISPLSLGKNTVAVGGDTLVDNINNFNNRVTPACAYVTATYGQIPLVVSIFSGGNDIRNGASAATIYANLQTYVGLVRTNCPSAKAQVSVYPVQCDISLNGAWVAVLQSLNNSVIANATVAQSSGGLGADGLVNYFSEPTVGANTYASSALCGFPNQYSPDGAHWSDLAKSIEAGVESAALSTLIGH